MRPGKALQDHSRADLEGLPESGQTLHPTKDPIGVIKPRALFVRGPKGIGKRSGRVGPGLPRQLVRATRSVEFVERVRIKGEWVTNQEPQDQEGWSDGTQSHGATSASAKGPTHGAQYASPPVPSSQGGISVSPPTPDGLRRNNRKFGSGAGAEDSPEGKSKPGVAFQVNPGPTLARSPVHCLVRRACSDRARL